MNGILIGKRIPVGAAITGLINFSAYMWNVTHIDGVQLSIVAVGAVSIPLTALAQVIWVNRYGVTTKPEG